MQFIVFGHNEHEIGRRPRKWRAGVSGWAAWKLSSLDDDVSPIRNRELVRIALRTPHLTRSEYYAANGHEYTRGICHQLWKAPVLNWDGRLTGCCRNFWGDFGVNAFDAGLEDALAGEKFRHAKQMLMGLAESRPDIPCTTCDLYHTMQRDKRWITRSYISPRRLPPLP